MTEQWTGTARTALRDLDLTDRVRLASWFAILAHAAITGWALAGSWFYADDFVFLQNSYSTPVSIDFLFTPHDNQLMPIGTFVYWLVAQAGPFSWTAAAASTVALAVVAAWACTRMLRTLFGERPLILVPLVFYAITPMAIEGWVWWAAALNSLPMHIAFFLGITAVVQWWRSRRAFHLAATLGAVLLGALSGPRGLVMVVPLGLVVLLVLVPPTMWRTPVQLLRRLWPLVVSGLLLTVAYLVLYRSTTPSPLTTEGSAPLGAITRNLLLESWLPAVFGGPLSWDEYNPPMNKPEAPTVFIVLAGVVLLGALVWCAARHRRRTVTAMVILAAQLSVTLAALFYGRGLQLGAEAGLLTRYLTDTVPVTALVIGLLLIPVTGAGPGSGTRLEPPSLGRWPVPVTAVVATAFVVTSLTSTVTYMQSWHADYPARAWVETASTQLVADPGPIADIAPPNRVMWTLFFPENLPSNLLSPIGDALQAVDHGTNLRILDDDGVPRPAAVAPAVTSEPGTSPECGYRVDDTWTRVTLDADSAIFWWISLGYLASGDGEIDVQVDGRESFTMPVFKGLNTYVFAGESPVTSLRLRTATPGLTVCLAPVALGDLVPVP